MNDQPAPSPAPSAPGFVSTATAAALLMVTPEWIRRLTNDGWFPKHGKDQYRIQEVVQGYIKYLKDEARTSSKSASASRVQDARAREVDLRIDEREGRHLIAAQAEAISVIDEFGGMAKAELLALPARLTADLALRKRFTDGIDAAFGAAAKAAIAAADRVATAGDTLASLRKPAARRMGKPKSNLPVKPRRSRSA